MPSLPPAAANSGQYRNGGATPSACVAAPLAPFPWPRVPQPSGTTVIPNDVLFGPGAGQHSLHEVANRLEGAINRAGYFDRRYLGVGCNGFAVMLDLEHIATDGTRMSGTAGFVPPGGAAQFSLTGYVTRLFYARPGYYRQIVFVVTDESVATASDAPTAGELRAIASAGSAALPPDFARVPYTWRYRVLALVYEFEKGPSNGDARLIPPNGRLGSTANLKKARLY